MNNKVVCQICGKSFYSITASHLRAHGITRSEYSQKYGGQGLNKITYVKKPVDEVDKYYKERNIMLATMDAKRTKKLNLIKRAG